MSFGLFLIAEVAVADASTGFGKRVHAVSVAKANAVDRVGAVHYGHDGRDSSNAEDQDENKYGDDDPSHRQNE